MARKTVRSQQQPSSGPKTLVLRRSQRKTTSGSKTHNLHRESDQTVNTKRKTPSGSLVTIGKTTKVHCRSNHHQQTLSGSPVMVRKTPKLQVELPLYLVVSSILTRLPVKTLSKFRCVSKTLCSLISEPHFRKLHARNCQQIPLLLIAKADATLVHFSTYTIHGEQALKDFSISFAQQFAQPDDPEDRIVPFKLVQSCLGLVCLRTLFDGALLVFNPSTEEVITLPERPRQRFYICVGFGYTDFSDEFKVVRFFTHCLNVVENDISDNDCVAFRNSECLSEVFTLGSSDGWRKTRSPPFKPNYFAYLPLVHGALHFLPSRSFHKNLQDHYIFAFDLHTEQYRGISLPKFYFGLSTDVNQCVHQFVMAELRGSLCMSFYSMRFRVSNLLQLWFLKDYHGGKWVMECNIDVSLQPQLSLNTTFCVMGDDHILMNIDSAEELTLSYYNTKENCNEKTLGTNCSAIFHAASFLPLPLENRMAV